MHERERERKGRGGGGEGLEGVCIACTQEGGQMKVNQWVERKGK